MSSQMVVQWGSLIRDNSMDLLPVANTTQIPLLTAIPRFLLFSYSLQSLAVPYTILLLCVILFLIYS